MVMNIRSKVAAHENYACTLNRACISRTTNLDKPSGNLINRQFTILLCGTWWIEITRSYLNTTSSVSDRCIVFITTINLLVSFSFFFLVIMSENKRFIQKDFLPFMITNPMERKTYFSSYSDYLLSLFISLTLSLNDQFIVFDSKHNSA